ncbi:hypothetical protein BY996DRAFT_6417596 [Phakopsora pachyrhizi]|nr:hypothetical protein BY996DRAFT_6417596 [Phakopsora pachyrhizi]
MGISLDRISRKTFLWKLTLAICILIINIINENSRFVECEEHSSYQPDETEEELYSELDEDNIINCSGAVLTVTNANQDSVHEVICQTSGMNPLKYRCSDEQIRDFPKLNAESIQFI